MVQSFYRVLARLPGSPTIQVFVIVLLLMWIPLWGLQTPDIWSSYIIVLLPAVVIYAWGLITRRDPRSHLLSSAVPAIYIMSMGPSILLGLNWGDAKSFIIPAGWLFIIANEARSLYREGKDIPNWENPSPTT